jgi:serine protease AprX
MWMANQGEELKRMRSRAAEKPAGGETLEACALCGAGAPREVLREALWRPPGVLERLEARHAEWKREDGACPACVQQTLLTVLLERGEKEMHEAIQRVWPLDARIAFGALPTPLRMHADPRFAGRGVTMAFVDSAFFPHPDLVEPRNRIRAWADASRHWPGKRGGVLVRRFRPGRRPRWPGCGALHPAQWHGTMTSCSAAGNGRMSHGLYRGIASEADVVLVQTRPPSGHISSENIARAFLWLLDRAEEFGIRVVSCSVSGDPTEQLAGNAVDEGVRALVEAGITVIVAAGNDGVRRLIPPATSPLALTIGGLDDRNTFSHHDNEVWHSNYGQSSGTSRGDGGGMPKPELVAPSIWVAAPTLPGSEVAREAAELFARLAAGDSSANERIAALKLISPHYQHVEGTSFAAPLVASVVACLLEAHPALSPRGVREILTAAATRVPGAPVEQQGAGALDAGLAVAMALEAAQGGSPRHLPAPAFAHGRVLFHLHDRHARRVHVPGSWDGWRAPGAEARKVRPGLWQAEVQIAQPGRYAYKFLLDGWRWLEDPSNPRREHDGNGNLNSVFELPPPPGN